MAAPNKRVLTDEVRESLVSSDRPSSSGTPEDLVQRLRSVASRARKSVTEGYRTPPSFSKAQSTGTIFQSMNDTMREVYNRPAYTNPTNLTSRKRSRSVTGFDEQDSIAEDSEMPVDDEQEARITLPRYSSAGNIVPFARPIKNLRTSRRALLETHSLPNGSLSFGRGTDTGLEVRKALIPVPIDEDDWSAENSFQPSEQAFDPMIL